MTNRERARDLVEACIALNGYDQVAEIAHCLNEAEARGRRQGLEEAAIIADEVTEGYGAAGDEIRRLTKRSDAGDSKRDQRGRKKQETVSPKGRSSVMSKKRKKSGI